MWRWLFSYQRLFPTYDSNVILISFLTRFMTDKLIFWLYWLGFSNVGPASEVKNWAWARFHQLCRNKSLLFQAWLLVFLCNHLMQTSTSTMYAAKDAITFINLPYTGQDTAASRFSKKHNERLIEVFAHFQSDIQVTTFQIHLKTWQYQPRATNITSFCNY